jgi:hypothetical protein
MSVLRILCYNGSLVTWTVVSLTAAKFKPLLFSSLVNRESQSYFTTGGLPPISSTWRQAPWDSRPVFFFFQLITCSHSPYVTSSLTRGCVCRLQLLLALARAVIIGSESRGLKSIFYCLRFETPSTWRVMSPYLYPPGTEWASYTPKHWVPFSSPPTTRRATVEVFDSASTRSYHAEHTGSRLVKKSKFCHDRPSVGQSVLMSSTHLGLNTRFFFCLTVAGLLMWGALSDERMCLSFIMYNVQNIYILHVVTWGGVVAGWLSHYATSRKVAGSSPDEVHFFFNWPVPSSSTMALGSTQSLTEMSTWNLPGGEGRPARKVDKFTVICEPII